VKSRELEKWSRLRGGGEVGGDPPTELGGKVSIAISISVNIWKYGKF